MYNKKKEYKENNKRQASIILSYKISVDSPFLVVFNKYIKRIIAIAKNIDCGRYTGPCANAYKNMKIMEKIEVNITHDLRNPIE